jgi:hypothetical protein
LIAEKMSNATIRGTLIIPLPADMGWADRALGAP